MTPGRNCSTTMSARWRSGCRLCRPSGDFRSTSMLFLPPFNTAKGAECAPIAGGKRRRSSPPGFSTLITSAPASAIMNVARGPGSRVEKSRIVTPWSGNGIRASHGKEIVGHPARLDEPEEGGQRDHGDKRAEEHAGGCPLYPDIVLGRNHED